MCHFLPNHDLLAVDFVLFADFIMLQCCANALSPPPPMMPNKPMAYPVRDSDARDYIYITHMCTSAPLPCLYPPQPLGRTPACRSASLPRARWHRVAEVIMTSRTQERTNNTGAEKTHMQIHKRTVKTTVNNADYLQASHRMLPERREQQSRETSRVCHQAHEAQGLFRTEGVPCSGGGRGKMPRYTRHCRRACAVINFDIL